MEKQKVYTTSQRMNDAIRQGRSEADSDFIDIWYIDKILFPQKFGPEEPDYHLN